jgi:L-asparagine transporter-like permease
LILFNWSFIILSALRILENKIWGKISAIIGIILILAAVSGTLMEKSIRMGFFVSLIVVVMIGIVALIMQKKVWGKEKAS